MSARIITIGKKRYLAGMSWRSFDRAQKRRDLVDMGKTMFRDEDGEPMGAKWCAVRELSDEVVQAGFCRKLESGGSLTKLAALAPLVASVRIQPWLGIYKIEEGLWWYIAVRNGHTILPDGDAIGDEETILALREQHSGYGDWNYLKGGIAEIEALIAESQEKPSKVFSLTGSGIPPQYIAAGVGLTLAAAGGLWWMHAEHVRQIEHDREVTMMRAKVLMMKKMGKKPPPPALSPLVTQSMPDEWLTACLDTLSKRSVSMYGWMLKSFECHAGTRVISMTWLRADGATVLARPIGVLSADGNTVIDSVPMRKVADVGHDSGGPLPMEREAMLGWAQSLGITLALQDAARTPAPNRLPGAAAPDTDAQVQQQIASVDFMFSLAFEPRGLGLDGIPGARVQTMSFDGQKWDVSGKLYGN